MSTIETYKINETTRLRIVFDDYAYNPREDDNLGTLALTDNRYVSGDELANPDPEYYSSPNLVAFPVYAMIHGGVALSLGEFDCPWDSGQIGFIYAEKADIEDEDLTLEQVKSIFEAELKTFNAFLSGQVFGFILETWDPTPNVGWDGEDSCFGFYDPKDVLDYVDLPEEIAAKIREDFHHYGN